MSFAVWTPGMTIADIEEQAIRAALKYHGGNKAQTANSLKISLKTLYNKLEIYEVRDKEIAERKAALKKKDQEFLKLQRGNHLNSTIITGVEPQLPVGKIKGPRAKDEVKDAPAKPKQMRAADRHAESLMEKQLEKNAARRAAKQAAKQPVLQNANPEGDNADNQTPPADKGN